MLQNWKEKHLLSGWFLKETPFPDNWNFTMVRLRMYLVRVSLEEVEGKAKQTLMSPDSSWSTEDVAWNTKRKYSSLEKYMVLIGGKQSFLHEEPRWFLWRNYPINNKQGKQCAVSGFVTSVITAPASKISWFLFPRESQSAGNEASA